MTPTLPPSWTQHDLKVKPYLWAHRIPAIINSALSLLVLIYFIASSGWQRWSDWVESSVHQPFLQWLLFFGGLGLAWKVISLPFSFYHYRIEKRFGLSKQSVGSWFSDLGKGAGLGVVLGTMVLFIIYASVSYAPRYWWIVCGVLLILFSVVLAQLAPVIFIPLFFKLKPMEQSPLKERLFALCSKFNVKVSEVYHLGLGEKTEKGNAAFVGLGNTKRIIIGDTLYEKFPADSVEAVFAHELGHQVHNDLWKGIFLSAILMLVGFGIAHKITAEYLLPHFNTAFELPMGMFLFFITTSLVQMPLGIVQVLYSRAREWAADRFAAQMPELRPHLADALERLTIQNFGQFKPNAVVEFFTYSHPAPWRRITALRQN